MGEEEVIQFLIFFFFFFFFFYKIKLENKKKNNSPWWFLFLVNMVLKYQPYSPEWVWGRTRDNGEWNRRLQSLSLTMPSFRPPLPTSPPPHSMMSLFGYLLLGI